ncbi:unnamed protein product, partial [Sphacelaria rigidula]
MVVVVVTRLQFTSRGMHICLGMTGHCWERSHIWPKGRTCHRSRRTCLSWTWASMPSGKARAETPCSNPIWPLLPAPLLRHRCIRTSTIDAVSLLT